LGWQYKIAALVDPIGIVASTYNWPPVVVAVVELFGTVSGVPTAQSVLQQLAAGKT
jgi:hypothetical protein